MSTAKIKEALREGLEQAQEELSEAASKERRIWIRRIKGELRDSADQISSFAQMYAKGELTMQEAIQLSQQLAIVARGHALESLAGTQERGEELAMQLSKALLAAALTAVI